MPLSLKKLYLLLWLIVVSVSLLGQVALAEGLVKITGRVTLDGFNRSPLHIYVLNQDTRTILEIVDGSHQRSLPVPGDSAYTMQSWDSNNNGLADLVVGTNQGLAIFENRQGTVQAVGSVLSLTGPVTKLQVLTDETNRLLAVSNSVLTVVRSDNVAPVVETTIPLPAGILSLAAGDINADGLIDIVFGDNQGNIHIFHAGPVGFIPTGSHFAGLDGVQTVALGDINRNGNLDILAGGQGEFSILYHGENGFTLNYWGVPFVNSVAFSARFSALVDFDQNGFLDLVFASHFNFGTAMVVVYPNTGSGFGPPRTFFSGGEVSGLAVADYDHDGDIDLVLSDNRLGKILFIENELEHPIDWDFLLLPRFDLSPWLSPGVSSPVFLDPTAIQGVRISLGDYHTRTDQHGNYSLGVPAGSLAVEASKPGYTFERGNTVLWQADSYRISFAGFAATDPNQEVDSDGDGVSDAQELEDGSDPYDPGSRANRLHGPTFALWNGFLGLNNVLELVNTGVVAAGARVTLFSMDGVLLDSINIPKRSSGEQFDLILNSLSQFPTDSYGILRIDSKGNLGGRLIQYHGNQNIALSSELRDPIRGSSSVVYNTFNPSRDGTELFVTNWLSLANVSEETNSFSIRWFNPLGTVIAEQSILLQPYSRIDIDGGQRFGQSNIGLIEIVPHKETAPYLAKLVRYGYDSTGNLAFALSLDAKKGNGAKQHVLVSNTSENWIELANTSPKRVRAILTLTSSEGQVLLRTLVPLPPKSQQHLFLGALLPVGSYGLLTVETDQKTSILCHSIFYERDSSGLLSATFSVAAEEALGRRVLLSFNSFLETTNSVIVSNPTDSSTVVSLVKKAAESVASTFSIEPTRSTVVSLAEGEQMAAEENLYGTIEVLAASRAKLLSWLLRRSSHGFVIPIAGRH